MGASNLNLETQMKFIFLAAAMSVCMAGTALGNPVNSYNHDDHSINNTNVNANVNKNSNKNNNANLNANRNSAKQSQSQGQAQQQGQVQGIVGSGNSKVNVGVDGNNSSQSTTVIDEAQSRNPVSTAYAPPPVASEDTCMGSTTAGGQGVSFGISLGTTWRDNNCKRLKNSRELNAMGMHRTACNLLSQDADTAKALRDSGTTCHDLSDFAIPVVIMQSPVAQPETPKPPVVRGERG